MITHIIWDYNGTVLDDVRVSVAAVNEMLKKRGLSPTNIETYKDTLDIPIIDYYKGIGIYNESIESLSQEFNALCKKHSSLGGIFDDFFDIIQYTTNLGIKNILMSSLYYELLENEVDKNNIRKYFIDIIGMKNKKLGSKSDNAKMYLQKNSIDAKNVLFIGDLISDAKTAKEVGACCILVPNGHNSKARCQKEGVIVVDKLIEIKKYIDLY